MRETGTFLAAYVSAESSAVGAEERHFCLGQACCRQKDIGA